MKKLIILFSLIFLAPSLSYGEGEKHFDGKGIIVKIDKKNGEIGIKHEDIEGYMSAMTMLFPLKDKKLLKGLKKGDSISFKLEVVNDEDKIIEIKKITGSR